MSNSLAKQMTGQVTFYEKCCERYSGNIFHLVLASNLTGRQGKLCSFDLHKAALASVFLSGAINILPDSPELAK